MEIDRLKEIWKNDNPKIPEIPLEKIKTIYSPLEMIKINMQTEFWLMILTFPLYVTMVPFDQNDKSLNLISIMVIGMTFLIMLYYILRFRRLYKVIQDKNDVNTNYSLFNLKSKLLIAKELYLSYYISYIPMLFVLTLLQFKFHFDIKYNMVIFSIVFLLSICLIYLFYKFWSKYMYGNYIEDIVYLVDELNGITSEKKSEVRKIILFEKTQKYFINKLGLTGNVLNTIIWLVFVYISTVVILTIFFVVLILIFHKLDLVDLQALLISLEEI